MSYDLLLWPVDRAMSSEDAIAEIRGRTDRWPVGLGHDQGLDPFVRAMEHRFPGLRGPGVPEPPMEFDVHRSWIFIALPWLAVAELVEVIAPIAFAEGLAIYDPQLNEVALPQPFGTAPLGTSGVGAHVDTANRALDAIVRGASAGLGSDGMTGIGNVLRGAGFREISPLGFEITPDIEAEVMTNPLRVPTKLQTDDRKAELIGELGAGDTMARHLALTTLSGWDPDPEVRAALRPLLESDDVFVAGQAARAIANQGDRADLDAVLATVHRMSPADGGSAESMFLPLLAALDLARRSGDEALVGAKAKARSWLSGPADRRGGRHSTLDDELARLLD